MNPTFNLASYFGGQEPTGGQQGLTGGFSDFGSFLEALNADMNARPRVTGFGQQDLWAIQGILADPSVSRLLSAEGRERMFADLAGEVDSSYRYARTAGLGSLAASGLSGSGAGAELETRLSTGRGTALADVASRASVQHGSAVAGMLTGLWDMLNTRETNTWLATQQLQASKGGGGGWGKALAGIAGGVAGSVLGPLGAAAGSSLASSIFPEE